MGKFDGVLLASDYDDTLRPFDREDVPEETIEAIRWFESEGGIFMVATGRSYTTFERVAGQLELRHPAVVSNGAGCRDMQTGEELFSRLLPRRCREDARQVLDAFPEIGMEAYQGENFYAIRPNEQTRWHMELVGAWSHCYEADSPLDVPLPWTKALFQGARKELERVREYILERWGEHYENVFSADHLLELTAKGVHKGSGVVECARRLGISPEHIYCVGDNDNDIPLRSAARLLFAPENAVDGMKEAADIVVPSASDHCVAHIIKILDGIYSA